MADTADILIIGAGVVGCSIAYHLAVAGQRKVVVVERDLICSGSSGLAAGGIRLQFASALNIRLSQEALASFKRMPEELGIDPGLRQVGYIFLATTEAEMALFTRNVALQQSLGVPVQALSPAEIGRLVPQVRLDGILGGTYCPADGYAAPYEVTMGYAAAARKRGVRILEQRPVTGIRLAGGRVAGVETREGPIHAPLVVNCAGPQAGLIGQMVGLDVPVKPYRRQLFTTRPLSEFAAEPPLTIDYHRNWYFRGEMGGCLFSGPKDEESTFNTNVDWEHLAESVEMALVRLPILAEAEIHKGWAGLYEITPDSNAIMGPVAELPGFWVAAGFSGHGFQHGPITGQLMAELLLTGTSRIDVTALGIDRFRTGRGIAEPMTMHQA
ncbi:MAG: FAD-binding oxidoreductase [Candidatus Methylomirabilota bacterium]